MFKCIKMLNNTYRITANISRKKKPTHICIKFLIYTNKNKTLHSRRRQLVENKKRNERKYKMKT